MAVKLARALVVLAARSLGAERQAWGQAMEAELEAAIDDGRPLGFGIGCLVAAWRELPAHAEGRLALARHVLAIGLMIPIAGVSLWCGLLGYPYLALGNVSLAGFLAGNSQQIPLLNDGDWAVAPSVTLLILIQASSQLLLAWFVLEQDWGRVAAIGRFNAATLMTLAIVTSLLGVMVPGIAVPVVALMAEMLAAFAFAHSEEQLRNSPLLHPG